MVNKDIKVLDTKTMSSEQLERCDGTIRHIQEAWENLPEDIYPEEREMFVELVSKILKLHYVIRKFEKDQGMLN